MSQFLTTTDTLTVKHCPVCYIQYAAPEAMFKKMQSTGGTWFCPNGHNLVFSENTIEKLEKRLKDAAEQSEYYSKRISSLHNQLTDKNNAIRAEKAAKTRLKNRIKNGVCPCCNRSFHNVARHMETMHPDFLTKD